MAVLTPQPKMQFTTAAGVPLSGGKVYTYIAGTTTPQATFTDYTGATPNTNPVILNSRGEANIWLGGALYKFKLTDANDVEIWTVDYISAPTSAVSPVLSGNVTIDSDTPGPALKITQTGTGPVLRVQDSADPDATPFIIDNAGNVGIGTAVPAAALDIAVNSASSAVRITQTGAGSAFRVDDETNPDPSPFIITSAGDVGIGNASPSAKLDVTGNAVISGNAVVSGNTTVSGVVAVGAGTAAAPSISFSGDDNTGIYSPGADRIGFTEGGVQVGEFDASGNLQFNSGYGSVAVAYGCRAWVNFDGTSGTIRASGNISSVVRNSTGRYTVNLTTAMPDANGSVVAMSGANNALTTFAAAAFVEAQTTSQLTLYTGTHSSGSTATYVDMNRVCIALFR